MVPSFFKRGSVRSSHDLVYSLYLELDVAANLEELYCLEILYGGSAIIKGNCSFSNLPRRENVSPQIIESSSLIALEGRSFSKIQSLRYKAPSSSEKSIVLFFEDLFSIKKI